MSKHRNISKHWKRNVLERDNHTCQHCGSTQDLTVHHVVPYHVDPSLKNALHNGLTLCRTCHDYEHGMTEAGKGQWRKKKREWWARQATYSTAQTGRSE